VSEWSEWAKVGNVRYHVEEKNGVPVEVMCDLANTIGADPWFTIPIKASDDFIRQFAARVRDNLNPGLKAYFELSNEIWNGGFGQAQYCEQMGVSMGLDSNAFYARMYYYSMRAVEMFQLVEETFGGTDRIVRTIGSQAANYGVSDLALSYQNAYEHTDALAIAPYFGGYLGESQNEGWVQGMSVDAVIDELWNEALPQAINWMHGQAGRAAQYGVDLVAYEGGQHIVGIGTVRDNGTLNALFDAVNRDPRMGDIYYAYLQAWIEATDGVFTHFTDCGSFTRWGRWGAKEYMTQANSSAPKHAAIQDFIVDVQAAQAGY
jgi:hypothetical protein